MKKFWQQLESKFNVLSQRERVLICIAALVLIGMVLYLPVESAFKERQKLSRQLAQIENENNISSQQVELYQQRLAMDPNTDFRNRLIQIQQETQLIDADLDAQMVSMVPASYMPTVLTNLLGNVQGVKLISFGSIAPTPLLQVGDEHKMNLYSHGIKLTLEGSYFSILKFVESIEAMPEKLYWKRLNYHVDEHPNATVELELYTLSINKEFISVAE